ncbi:MAG: hypothetical protein LBC73_10090 [Oscillospiraceae bacterium]|jgi:uncharacterized protein YPO0396|nr:hypothetical protein [Oscillospiraceae bacterium]
MQRAESISLFDKDEYFGILFEPTPGFRLYKLEVYNWGTFDEKVWSFSPHGETSLLTGDVGSGKSTLVDALITLMISPRKAAFNKAADSSARERTLTTYVKGYYGRKRSEGGVGRPEALRDNGHYSVLLATFQDSGLNQFVTIAQFFWFQDAGAGPTRFFTVADREMGIATDFAKFDKDVKVLKKRLKQNDDIQVFDDYASYALAYRRKLGNMQEQALDLFQQTISMKKVEQLTDFVRVNMLEPPNTSDDVNKLIAHFHDLNTAHEAVIKAKKQIELLTPLVENGIQYENLRENKEQLESARSALSSWFAIKVLVLLDSEIERCEQTLKITVAKFEHAESELKKINDSVYSTKIKINENGGGALEALKLNLENAEKDLEKIRTMRKKYKEYSDKLDISLPKTIDVFTKNVNSLPERKSIQEQKYAELSETHTNAVVEEKFIKQEVDIVSTELESLKSRKSNIPGENADKRKELCRTLGIAEDELPFVGELIEIRENEIEWEGAIERLLRSFGLSLLVPDEHYQTVAKWVNETKLGVRLVYYRVKTDDTSYKSVQSHKDSVSKKLSINSDSPFGIWLHKELTHRFPHICCANINLFYREVQAITKNGQIKGNGFRHEKDDRFDINDRKRYILGFSNHKKITTLEEDKLKLDKKLEAQNDAIRNIRKQQEACQDNLITIAEIERIKSFADIDTITKRNDIEELIRRITALESGSDILKELRTQLELLEKEEKSQQEKRDDLFKNKTISETNIINLQKKKNENKSIADDLSEELCDFSFPILQQHMSVSLENTKLTLSNEDRLEKKYRDWLTGEISKLSKSIESISNKTVALMTNYRNKYPEHTTEVDSSMDSLSEFKIMLSRLEDDGLPKFEQRFKKLLRENAINQIALFQTKLKMEQDTIKERIEQINESLSTIDYNEGRYIKLEYDDTYDSAIQDFRIQLRACTEGSFSGNDDEQYAEDKFLQVKEIIERFKGRPGETENDERWRQKVIDVRNWFLFAASEKWRETDEEYEHYKDSSGKSGGQKEKLAYTILAASLVYHFGINRSGGKDHSFRFVVIDEAFLKSSDDSARFGLELFKKLDLQLLIVTPLLKIPTIEPYISHVGFVYHDDLTHRSMLRDITIEEYRREKKKRERLLSNVEMV